MAIVNEKQLENKKSTRTSHKNKTKMHRKYKQMISITRHSINCIWLLGDQKFGVRVRGVFLEYFSDLYEKKM